MARVQASAFDVLERLTEEKVQRKEIHDKKQKKKAAKKEKKSKLDGAFTPVARQESYLECKICNAKSNSQAQFDEHLQSKKHRQRARAAGIEDPPATSAPPSAEAPTASPPATDQAPVPVASPPAAAQAPVPVASPPATALPTGPAKVEATTTAAAAASQAPPCSECEEAPTVVVCDVCMDGFCAPCRDATHSKGNRRKHTFTPYGTPPPAAGPPGLSNPPGVVPGAGAPPGLGRTPTSRPPGVPPGVGRTPTSGPPGVGSSAKNRSPAVQGSEGRWTAVGGDKGGRGRGRGGAALSPDGRGRGRGRTAVTPSRADSDRNWRK